jgi:hypothetical protein
MSETTMRPNPRSGVATAPLEGFVAHITSFGFNHALVSIAQSDTVILLVYTLSLTVIDFHSTWIYAVILLSSLSFSVKMTVSPLSALRW